MTTRMIAKCKQGRHVHATFLKQNDFYMAKHDVLKVHPSGKNSIHVSQGSASGHPMAQGHCVYALARQSLGNLAQAVIGSTQDPFELFIINVR